MNNKEEDPNGIDPHTPGSKLDAGKPRLGLVFHGFARALMEVGKVGSYGAIKYSPDGWMKVPEGISRYTDAFFRHDLKLAIGEVYDKESQLMHLAHRAWNDLAILELTLREMEKERDNPLA